MKKVLLLILLSAATVFTTASAQRKTLAPVPLKFSIGLELEAPIGDFRHIYSAGFGGSGKIEIPATRQLFITATAGYTNFYLKDDVKRAYRAFGLSTSPDGFVPLKVGGKYYFSPAFYGEAEIGAAIGTNHGSGTAFAYAPEIGTSIPLGGRNAIDVGLRFESWSQNRTVNQFALRVAYKF